MMDVKKLNLAEFTTTSALHTTQIFKKVKPFVIKCVLSLLIYICN